jgi:DNA-directed RNA polymerase subunit RPC12/RpoP
MARLIDADDVVRKLEYEIETQCEPVVDTDTEWEAFIKRVLPKILLDVIKYIKQQPTIDAVEVVHGRWEQVQRWATKAKYRCSVCGREVMSAIKVNIEKYPYCHCGAKMDGDV